VPFELVRWTAVASGMADIIRLGLDDAKFQPSAVVWRRTTEFAATVTYETPTAPGLRQELIVLLRADLRENAR
jgi:hypothetical protein